MHPAHRNSIVKIPSKINRLIFDESFRAFREVFWFAVLTLAIHFFYRFWIYQLHYWPIQNWMTGLHQWMTGVVFSQSLWVDRHILGLIVFATGKTMIFSNNSWITINESCAGDKQIMQFVLLLLLYPGRLIHKAWYIPFGVLVVHLTNILRIVLLSLVSVHRPEWWHLAHNSVLRGMFYVVILILWIVWVENFARKRSHTPD